MTMSSSNGTSLANRRWRMAASVSLGQAFDIGGTQNLAFHLYDQPGRPHRRHRIRRDRQRQRRAVPEPASGWLMLWPVAVSWRAFGGDGSGLARHLHE